MVFIDIVAAWILTLRRVVAQQLHLKMATDSSVQHVYDRNYNQAVITLRPIVLVIVRG